MDFYLLLRSFDKTKVLCLLLHSCDVSHPAKRWEVHHQWTSRSVMGGGGEVPNLHECCIIIIRLSLQVHRGVLHAGRPRVRARSRVLSFVRQTQHNGPSVADRLHRLHRGPDPDRPRRRPRGHPQEHGDGQQEGHQEDRGGSGGGLVGGGRSGGHRRGAAEEALAGAAGGQQGKVAEEARRR